VAKLCGPKALYRDKCPYCTWDKCTIYLPTIRSHDIRRKITDGSKEETAMKMFSKLLGNEETNAAAVLALSATIIALVAKGAGPVSTERMVSRVLSNPVPRLGSTGTRGADVSLQEATPLRTAA